jgi:homoserine kinase
VSVASVTVEAPATSANLGPGYDTLGLALDLRDVVEASVTWAESDAGNTSTEVRVQMEGQGAYSLPTDASHLIIRSMQATFAALGVVAASLSLRCRNAIPHGRGLGSSSAAIVAGVIAARVLAGEPDDPDAVVAMAAQLEGHPDNVAPCILGGLTIAWTDTPARAVRLDVHPDVRAVLAIPAESVLTETARGLLPAHVPHADAAFNTARSALMIEALTRRPELLLTATEDRLHQHYRAPAMPDTARVVGELRAAGLAATVSGAGPSVLVLATDDVREQVAAAAPGWDVCALAVDTRGAAVTTGRTTSG